MRAIMESCFNSLYLATIVTLGIWILVKAKNKKEFILFGIMSLILGFGDSFHLIPRILALNSTTDYSVWLGTGKLVTSITMTIFYIILYYFYLIRYNKKQNIWITLSVWALAFVRIVLCLMPQNNWIAKNPSYEWGLYRNIPFALLGIELIVLFAINNRKIKAYRFMWLAISLSFAFYIITVAGAHYVELLGLFMIPKTCAYVWIVVMGFIDEKNTTWKLK